MATILSTQLTDFFTNNRLIAPAKAPLSGVFLAEGDANVLTAHNDADDYRLFVVPGNAIPVLCNVHNTAITGGTDFVLGLFPYGESGTVKDADALLTTLSFAAAGNNTYAVSSTIANRNQYFWELAGDTEFTGQQYVVGLTANTVGSANGTVWISLFCKFSGN